MAMYSFSLAELVYPHATTHRVSRRVVRREGLCVRNRDRVCRRYGDPNLLRAITSGVIVCGRDFVTYVIPSTCTGSRGTLGFDSPNIQ